MKGTVTMTVKQTQKESKCSPEQKHKQIQLKAYELWQKAGSPLGRDQEFWYTAVAVVDGVSKRKKTC